MKVLYPAIFLCGIGFILADPNVASAFERTEIKPDILEESPQELVKVKYGDKIVELGNELTPTEVKDIPEIHYKHESSSFYTLIMTDPDAPSREIPTYREWHHWLVGNIPGEDVSKGEVFSQYIGSGPPKDTGLHRYVFLVYKQLGKIDFDEQRLTNTSTEGRAGFSTKKFSAKYNLGIPVAGNMFQAQYDDYVPLLQKQLGA